MWISYLDFCNVFQTVSDNRLLVKMKNLVISKENKRKIVNIIRYF